jgi:hypothetical protein
MMFGPSSFAPLALSNLFRTNRCHRCQTLDPNSRRGVEDFAPAFFCFALLVSAPGGRAGEAGCLYSRRIWMLLCHDLCKSNAVPMIKKNKKNHNKYSRVHGYPRSGKAVEGDIAQLRRVATEVAALDPAGPVRGQTGGFWIYQCVCDAHPEPYRRVSSWCSVAHR